MHMAVQHYGTLVAAIPGTHGVVVEPDVLTLQYEADLLHRLLKEGEHASLIMVAPDDVDVLAVDTVTQLAGTVQVMTPEHVADDPQVVVAADDGIVVVDERGIHPLDGLLADTHLVRTQIPGVGRGDEFLLLV